MNEQLNRTVVYCVTASRQLAVGTTQQLIGHTMLCSVCLALEIHLPVLLDSLSEAGCSENCLALLPCVAPSPI